MSADMVHRNKGLVQRPCQGFGIVRSYQQGTDESGGTGCRNGIHLRKFHAGFPYSRPGYAADGFNMSPAGDFRHHAAVQRMLFRL